MEFSKEKHTLLCWHSARAGTAVLLQAIKSLKNRKIIIEQVIYLLQKDNGSQGELSGLNVQYIESDICDPTSHNEIYGFVSNIIHPLITGYNNLHINVSPGTPAMHAVWLIMHAAGRYPSGTRIWSSQYNPQTQRNSISEVNFPITTYLSEINRIKNGNQKVALYSPESNSLKRKDALEQLKRYALVPGAPILVLGERGLGKTRLVETFVSKIKGKEIVSLPCGGLDSTIAESMLFGHKKGAFTGAENERKGLLKKADKQVLFLDEVQDLPKDIQRKLVRILQDDHHLFRPMGADDEESVTFELVCASNLSLEKLRRILDSDFFDRISHFLIEIPPLRECREDIENDWKNVWNEMQRVGNYNCPAPWNAYLAKSINSNPLDGNLRSLQKLALLVMAWKDIGEFEAIKKAVSIWIGNQTSEEDFVESKLGIGTRDERIGWFKNRLANWAKDTFGTWEKAARELNCDEKTLRLDAVKKEKNELL